jgi:hypothetical protein
VKCLRSFLCSLARTCHRLKTLVADGIILEENPGDIEFIHRLHELTHVSLGYLQGAIACSILEAILSENFAGSIDLKFADLSGFEERLTAALIQTRFSKIDLSGVTHEKEIVIKSSFI